MFICLLWWSHEIGLCVTGEPEVLMKKWFNRGLSLEPVCVCLSVCEWVCNAVVLCCPSFSNEMGLASILNFKKMKMDGWKMRGKRILLWMKEPWNYSITQQISHSAPAGMSLELIHWWHYFFYVALISELVWHLSWASLWFVYCCLSCSLKKAHCSSETSIHLCRSERRGKHLVTAAKQLSRVPRKESFD